MIDMQLSNRREGGETFHLLQGLGQGELVWTSCGELVWMSHDGSRHCSMQHHTLMHTHTHTLTRGKAEG